MEEVTAAETIGTSQRQQQKGDATTVLASTWTPTAQYERQQHISFRGNSPKSRQNGEKSGNKDVNRGKIPHFLSHRFKQFWEKDVKQ
jgi:hypothetical protein